MYVYRGLLIFYSGGHTDETTRIWADVSKRNSFIES